MLCGPTLPAWVPCQETSGSSLSTLAKDTRCHVRPSQPRPPSPEGNEVPPCVRVLLRLHWTALACLRLAVSPCPVGVSGAHPQPGATAEVTSAGAPGEQAPGAGTGLHGPDSCPVPSLNSVRRRSVLCGRRPALSFHRSLGGGRSRRRSGRLSAGFPRTACLLALCSLCMGGDGSLPGTGARTQGADPVNSPPGPRACATAPGGRPKYEDSGLTPPSPWF